MNALDWAVHHPHNRPVPPCDTVLKSHGFPSHTGSLHQPHLAPAWMHFPQYSALAAMHSFPSGSKTKKREGKKGGSVRGSRSAAQSLQRKQHVKPLVFTHQLKWNILWLDGNRRQNWNIPFFSLSSVLCGSGRDLLSVASNNTRGALTCTKPRTSPSPVPCCHTLMLANPSVDSYDIISITNVHAVQRRQ